MVRNPSLKKPRVSPGQITYPCSKKNLRHSPGGNASGNPRGPPERVEAEVAALKEKVAELRERNGKLEGKVEVLQDDRERLFRIVEARPKQ